VIPDSLRLAVGTLTAVPVRPPRRVDRTVAGRALLWAPLVGLALALLGAVVIITVRLIGGAPEPAGAWEFRYGWAWVTRNIAADLLAAALAIALLARLTRALHLDGLIDTADGFGVKGEGPDVVARRLAVMRRPDAGAFGVVTVVVVLLVQVAALAMCLLTGHGTVGLITAVVTGRLALLWSATPLVRAARGDGLGAAFAGSVRVGVAAGVTVAVMALAAGLGALDDDATVRLCVTLAAAVLVGLAGTAMLLRSSARAFGGVTGDEMGAAVELATATVLVVVAIAG
jgi:adenosylcobinamide-GDP ribazoletransferase